MRRLAVIVLAATLVALAAGVVQSSTAAGGPIVFWSCSPSPDDCSGWYRANVRITWSYTTSGLTSENCPAATISFDTTGTSAVCKLQYGSTSVQTTVTIKRDATAPSVNSGGAARGPDANGWYNHPVGIGFSGSDATSGIAGCTSTTYSGPDGPNVSVSGTCTDVAGNTSSSSSFSFSYDGTPPQVTGATPSRPPDVNGWYNHAVSFAFQGTDAVSGLDGCSTTTYSGPDGASAAVKGTCRDKAGNTSAETAVPLKYDATPPAFKRLRAVPGNGRVSLSWTAGRDVASVVVVRAPVKRGAKGKVVFHGRAGSFVDRRVTNGVRYRYTVVLADEAGNAAGRSTLASPNAPLRVPPDGARVHAPVVLAWRGVPRATYYNVQLRRDGVKVMSVWPTRPRLVVPAAWTFAGARERLTPGRYRWDVWPGFGPRSSARYGARLGTSNFVVR